MDLHPLPVRVLRENLVIQDFLVNLVRLGQKDGMARLENLDLKATRVYLETPVCQVSMDGMVHRAPVVFQDRLAKLARKVHLAREVRGVHLVTAVT